MDSIQTMGFSLPMTSAAICLILVLMYYCRRDSAIQRRLNTLMILICGADIFGWVCVILYIIHYHTFVLLHPFFFLILMLEQVLLYHFVFTITRTETTGTFPKSHYIIPVVLAAALGIWSLVVPYEVMYHLVESRGDLAPGYKYYSLFFLCKVPVFILFNLLYSFLGLLRIRAYCQAIVDYSADEQRVSSRWLFKLIFLIWLTLPVASLVLFAHKSVIFSSTVAVVGAFLPIFKSVIICYNLISGNYVIIHPASANDNEATGQEKNSKVNRQKFEVYIQREKPYLNPSLKITDLCTELGTNRTYLSTFINSEYGMNFSRFINHKRLLELDRLRTLPQSKKQTNMDLVLMAGFSSYRSYLRTKDANKREKFLTRF